MEEQSWKSKINNIRKEADGKKPSKERLKAAIVNAVNDKKRFGVLFSGGVDSSTISLIAKQKYCDFVCYTVGFREEGMSIPPDIVYAKKVAEELNLNFVYVLYNLEEAERIIKSVVKILKEKGKVSVVNVGVGCVDYAVIQLAKHDGIRILYSGLGSEELFAGYERHRLAGDIQEECWKGLLDIYDNDIIRDETIAGTFGVMLRTPFLDDDVISEAMKFPAEKKLTKVQNKIILRKISEELGLKKEFAQRKKKAAQYGSYFDKAIAKLAKKKNMSKSEYLDSL